MSEHKRRVALETIAYAADASPADRMRALELLRELAPSETDRAFRADLASIPAAQLEQELASFFQPLACELDEQVAGHLEHREREQNIQFARRSRELEAAFADRVEKRANELAREKYVMGGIEQAEQLANAREGAGEPLNAETADESSRGSHAVRNPENAGKPPSRLPPGLTQADLNRGFPSDRRSDGGVIRRVGGYNKT